MPAQKRISLQLCLLQKYSVSNPSQYLQYTRSAKTLHVGAMPPAARDGPTGRSDSLVIHTTHDVGWSYHLPSRPQIHGFSQLRKVTRQSLPDTALSDGSSLSVSGKRFHSPASALLDPVTAFTALNFCLGLSHDRRIRRKHCRLWNVRGRQDVYIDL